MRRFALVLVLCLAVPAPAAGQTCLGGVSFAAAPVRMGGGAVFSDDGTSWIAALQAGRDNALFGSVGFGQTTYDDFDDASNQGFLELGYQVPAGRRTQVCPIAGVAYARGPDDDQASRSAWFASAGFALGVALGTPSVRVIPNASVKYQLASYEDDRTDGTTDAYDDHLGVADIGIGFLLFHNRLAIQPTVQLPFATDDPTVSYRLLVSVGIGVRR